MRAVGEILHQRTSSWQLAAAKLVSTACSLHQPHKRIVWTVRAIYVPITSASVVRNVACCTLGPTLSHQSYASSLVDLLSCLPPHTRIHHTTPNELRESLSHSGRLLDTLCLTSRHSEPSPPTIVRPGPRKRVHLSSGERLSDALGAQDLSRMTASYLGGLARPWSGGM